MKESAGTLLYRHGPDGLEVLLVHPSGNYNRRAPWGIPKGLVDDGETPEAAARRETREETGVEAGDLVSVGHIDYTRSKKRVHCFVGAAPADAAPRRADQRGGGAAVAGGSAPAAGHGRGADCLHRGG